MNGLGERREEGGVPRRRHPVDPGDKLKVVGALHGRHDRLTHSAARAKYGYSEHSSVLVEPATAALGAATAAASARSVAATAAARTVAPGPRRCRG